MVECLIESHSPRSSSSLLRLSGTDHIKIQTDFQHLLDLSSMLTHKSGLTVHCNDTNRICHKRKADDLAVNCHCKHKHTTCTIMMEVSVSGAQAVRWSMLCKCSVRRKSSQVKSICIAHFIQCELNVELACEVESKITPRLLTFHRQQDQFGVDLLSVISSAYHKDLGFVSA